MQAFLFFILKAEKYIMQACYKNTSSKIQYERNSENTKQKQIVSIAFSKNRPTFGQQLATFDPLILADVVKT